MKYVLVVGMVILLAGACFVNAVSFAEGEAESSIKKAGFTPLSTNYTVSLLFQAEGNKETISFLVASETFSVHIAESLVQCEGMLKPKKDGSIFLAYKLTKKYPLDGDLKKAKRFIDTILQSSAFLQEGGEVCVLKTETRSIIITIAKTASETEKNSNTR